MKNYQFDELTSETMIPPLKVGPIEHMDLVRYSGASGDFNPIHTDPEFAKSVGLPGTIAHGMYIMALMGRFTTNWVHPEQIHAFDVKFKNITRPGETIICSGKVKKKKVENGLKLVYLEVDAKNETGEIKVSGEVVIRCT